MPISFHERAVFEKGEIMVKVLLEFSSLAVWALHFNKETTKSRLLGLETKSLDCSMNRDKKGCLNYSKNVDERERSGF